MCNEFENKFKSQDDIPTDEITALRLSMHKYILDEAQSFTKSDDISNLIQEIVKCHQFIQNSSEVYESLKKFVGACNKFYQSLEATFFYNK